tara:strand:+ start:1051 stop:1944 length:894 start_codon:yes stop_codon:yes gene_type:complete
MAKDFADDTKIPVEDEPQTDEDLGGLASLLPGNEKSEESEEGDAEEGVEEQPETDETGDETEKVAEKPTEHIPAIADGPSQAMMAVAEQAGLPSQLVAIARDDQQVQDMMDLARLNRQEPAAQKEFGVSLPEDEFPEDDPVRQEFDKFKDKFSELSSQLADANARVRAFEEKQGSVEHEQFVAQQREFDQTLDSLGSTAFGKSTEPTDASVALRTAAFNLLYERKQSNPGASISELSQMIAEEFGIPSTKTPREKAALRDQASRRLGGGPSKPAAAAAKNPEEGMRAFLQKLGIAGQ